MSPLLPLEFRFQVWVIVVPFLFSSSVHDLVAELPEFWILILAQ